MGVGRHPDQGARRRESQVKIWVRQLSGWTEAELLDDRGHEVVVRVGGKRRAVPAKKVRREAPPSSTPELAVDGVCYDGGETKPVPKVLPARDKVYLAWIRTQPCSHCGAPPPSEASHHGLRGVGTKASDHEALPACRACHAHHHQVGRFPGQESLSRHAYRETLQARAEQCRREFLKLRSQARQK